MSLAALLLSAFLPAHSAASAPPPPVNLWPLYMRRPLADGVETEALFWFYAHRREGTRSSTVLRPLLRHERSPERLASRLFPLYDLLREEGLWRLGLGGLHPFTVAEFAVERGGESRRGRVLFWRRDVSPERARWEFPPLWSYSYDRSGAERVSLLGAPDRLNLFERRLEPARGLREWHALSVWRRESPEDSYLHVWPLFGRRVRGQRVERSVFWPLAVHTEEPPSGLSALQVWPLWKTRRAHAPAPAGEEALAMVLPLPVYYRSVSREGSSRRFAWLHWSVRSPRRRLDVVGPWYSSADGSGSVVRGLFPVYHSSRRDGRSFDAVLPLYASWRDGPTGLTTAFPLYWRWTDERAERTYLFPFYGQTRRGGTVTRRVVLFPLYQRSRDPFSLDVLWPLFHVSRSSEASQARALPLWWSGRSPSGSFAAAPLYFRVSRGGETRSALLPLYWRVSSAGRDRRSFVPLGGFERDGERRELFALGLTPAVSLARFRRAPGELRDRALLWARWRDSRERGLTLFPLYDALDGLADGARSRAWLGVRGGLSLFETSHAPKAQTRSTRALLYYRRTAPGAETTVLAPLYWRFRTEGRTRLWLAPFYSLSAEEGPPESHWGVLGLSPRWSVLSRRSAPGDTETRFLWRLVRVKDSAAESAVEVNPLFFTLREGERRYTAVLGGLVGRETGPDGARWRWLWAF